MPEWLENLLKYTQKKVEDAAYETSRNAMHLAWSGNEAPNNGPKLKATKLGEEYTPQPREDEPRESTAQATYLLPRSLQRKKFLEHGYIEGKPKDYGLVRAAVGNNNFPVFQTAPDVISRDYITPIGNYSNWDYVIPKGTALQHAGHTPSAFYIDKDYKVYTKDWDLNDYGNANGRAGATYPWYKQIAANLLDIIGSPVVVTTGFQPALDYDGNQHTLQSLYKWNNPMAIKFVQDKGLAPFYEEIPVSLGSETDKEWKNNGWKLPTKTELTMFTLPELIVTAKRKKK